MSCLAMGYEALVLRDAKYSDDLDLHVSYEEWLTFTKDSLDNGLYTIASKALANALVHIHPSHSGYLDSTNSILKKDRINYIRGLQNLAKSLSALRSVISQPRRRGTSHQGAPRAMAGTASTPCASCKLLRRRCTKECVFAPYFPPEDPHKFAIVHKVFGASNVSKMLQELPAQQRADAVSSLVYEANARMRDPVYGCVGAISYLQHQVSQLQMQLAVAQAEILRIQMQHDGQTPASALQQLQQQEQQLMEDKAYNSLIMQNGLMNTLSSSASHHQLMGFGSAGSTAMMLQEACLKKESLWT